MQYFKAAVIGIIAVALASVAMLFVIDEADASTEWVFFPAQTEDEFDAIAIKGFSEDELWISCKTDQSSGFSMLWMGVFEGGNDRVFSGSSQIWVSTKPSTLPGLVEGKTLWDVMDEDGFSKVLFSGTSFVLYEIAVNELLRSLAKSSNIHFLVKHHNGVEENISFHTHNIFNVQGDFRRRCLGNSSSKTPSSDGASTLFQAIRTKDVGTVRRIVASSGRNVICAKDRNGYTPYQLADILDYVEIRMVLFSAKGYGSHCR